jgi:hypothetical protein
MATDLHTTHVIINWSAVNILIRLISGSTRYHSQNLVNLFHCIDFIALISLQCAKLWIHCSVQGNGFSESQ